jgi:3-oxoacyl-[acyl-carrier-protein] synthase II
MAYINGAASISPQNTLSFNEFKAGMHSYREEFLQSLKPDLKDFIKPADARRMSKTVKNGIIASSVAMSEAGTNMPDAIIVGTGLGIVTDTEKFLENMLDNNEQFLTPTAFIQSTHNTVAAQIALNLKCHNYNFTYVNRGFSFESALLDGMMHIDEGKKEILIGGADEMSQHYFNISKKAGWWKTETIANEELLKSNSNGALCGEGVSFFVLSNEKKSSTYAFVNGLKMIYKPVENEIHDALDVFLSEHHIDKTDIDIVIVGKNGDIRFDGLYDTFLSRHFPNKTTCCFKHLTGEYHTASSFGLWLAANLIKTQDIPDFVKLNDKTPDKIKHILIYNHYFNINHSFILVSEPI